MKAAKLVPWRDGPHGPTGTCIEVSRDRAVTASRTLCGYVVLFPGPTHTGEPSCPSCKAKAASKPTRAHRASTRERP